MEFSLAPSMRQIAEFDRATANGDPAEIEFHLLDGMKIVAVSGLLPDCALAALYDAKGRQIGDKIKVFDGIAGNFIWHHEDRTYAIGVFPIDGRNSPADSLEDDSLEGTSPQSVDTSQHIGISRRP
ncbi:MAG: hypothetical protein ING19_00700 [Azospirillum sp.]|nr:hypothetical protein [Azospirillum sp.]